MKKLLSLLLLCIFGNIYAQDNNAKTYHFQMGMGLHVTPIYLQKIPDFVVPPSNNVLPEDDEHYSGLAIGYSIEKEFADDYLAVFNQQLRYDLLYIPLRLPFQSFDPSYHLRDKKALTTDLSIDFIRRFPVGQSFLNVGLGIGVGGLGSKYLVTESYSSTNGQTLLVTSERDYIYPFGSFVFSWARKNVQANLRMNYCWDNPGFFATPFLQPQLGLQYRLFSF